MVALTGGHPGYRKVLEERIALHVEKSAGYGSAGDPFANFTLVAHATGQPRYLYPVHRSLEKLTRILSLHAQGRTGELEEEFKDIASLMDCATAMLREDACLPVRLHPIDGDHGTPPADPEGSVA